MKKLFAAIVLALSFNAAAQDASPVFQMIPKHGYTYKQDDILAVFYTREKCGHPDITKLDPAGKKGLFQTRLFKSDMSEMIVEGCAAIENEMVIIRWYNNHGGDLRLEELTKLSDETTPPETTVGPRGPIQKPEDIAAKKQSL